MRPNITLHLGRDGFRFRLCTGIEHTTENWSEHVCERKRLRGKQQIPGCDLDWKRKVFWQDPRDAELERLQCAATWSDGGGHGPMCFLVFLNYTYFKRFVKILLFKTKIKFEGIGRINNTFQMFILLFSKIKINIYVSYSRLWNITFFIHPRIFSSK